MVEVVFRKVFELGLGQDINYVFFSLLKGVEESGVDRFSAS